MQMLPIPGLGREVSRLGIGSMIFHPERSRLVGELLDHFGECGGNLIDTAACYGGGWSERAIADYFRETGSRERWVLLDKAFDNAPTLLPERIAEAVAGNLERAGTEWLDLFGFHRDNTEVPVGEIVDAIDAEVRAGRVRAWGGSNWTIARIAEANAYAAAVGKTPMSFSSPHVCLARSLEPFWPLCTQASDEDLAWYRDQALPVLAWSSQGRGFFLPASGRGDESDLRRVYGCEANWSLLERTREMARAKGVEPVQLALAWVLGLEAPVVALVGPATRGEIDSSVAALAIELTPAERAWLETGSEAA